MDFLGKLLFWSRSWSSSPSSGWALHLSVDSSPRLWNIRVFCSSTCGLLPSSSSPLPHLWAGPKNFLLYFSWLKWVLTPVFSDLGAWTCDFSTHCMRANRGITERSEEVQPRPKTYRGQWEGTLGMLLGCGCWKHWTQKNAVEGFCSCHLAAGSLCISPFCFLKTSPSWCRMPVGGGSSESLKKQLRNGAFPNELCHQNQPPSSRELWKYWGKSGSICKHGEPEEIRSINNLSWTLHPLLSLSNPPWANQQLCSSVKADTVCAFCGVMWWPLIDFGHGLAVRAGYLGRAITSTCNHPGQWPRQVVLQQSLDTFLHAASVLQLSSSFGRISSAALKHLLAGNEASWPFNLGFQGFGYLWWSFGWIFLWKR